MSYIADLHIHSRYSRATSKASTLHGLAVWAAIKGIDVVATGDFTHPGWFAHLTENLEPAEPGFFRLKEPPSFAELAPVLPPGVQPDTSKIRFILSSEISSIYKRGGKVRKVHNLLYAPDFAAVRRINTVLAGIGNLESDGRPILGLDSKILLEILLEKAPDGFFIPAHIWTPWFSLFGSKSGFDSIEECFDDLSSEIFALETGLSSDPEMNRHISALDRFSLISNSDCHSPSKLGRNSNVFATGFDFFSMREALRYPATATGEQRFKSTIEFYPEEGKYHCDGHRKCGVCFEPAQTVKAEGICPECGKPVTVGVLYRVMELADRDAPVWPTGSPAVHSLIPLPEMLGELFNCGPATKKVAAVYGKLINSFGSEFSILLETPIAEIAVASPLLATAIERVRQNKVIRQPGFDGEFGVIRVFEDKEREALAGQLNLFGVIPAKPRKKQKRVKKFGISKKSGDSISQLERKKKLNPEQQAAVDSDASRIIVQAGPGTGKTHTLVQRVVRLLKAGQERITVITFTNKAAEEVQQRLTLATKEKKNKQRVQVKTFHGFCLHWLRRHNPDIQLAGPEMRNWVLKKQYPHLTKRERKNLQQEVALFLAAQSRLPETTEEDTWHLYFTYLREQNLLDLDEVIPACTALMHQDNDFAEELRKATGHLLVDEFQDLNAAQYELVRLLAQTSTVFAIGDPDQAIYGFRGSTPTWFHRFVREQEPEYHHLSTNYRNGSNILRAAGSVIAVNHEKGEGSKERITEALSSNPGRIYHHRAANTKAEAAFIADQVQRLIGGTSHREVDRVSDFASEGRGLALSEIAVLYRTSRQAEIIAEALADRTIPCQLVGLRPFYQKGDAKIIYYWILFSAGRIDRAELLFLLSRETGIGAKTLKEAEGILAEKDKSDQPFLILSVSVSQLSEYFKQCLRTMTALSSRLVETAQQKSVAAAVDLLLESYDMDKNDADILRLHRMAASAVSLSSFAEHLRRHQDSVIYYDRAESVLLATLHAAKGLEFKAVFVAGCEENLLPLAPRTELMPEAEQEHIQEERRLFFVGMTRAAEVLYLTGAENRQGFTGVEQCTPSRFLAEIPVDLLKNPSSAQKKQKKKSSGRQLKLF